MEGQAIELLERQIERLEHYPEIRTKLQDHLNQTRGQQAALQQTFNLRGGALGAFQAGVSEALEAAEMPPTGWPASVGALNAALIAGNPPGRRLERLRAFWDLAAEPGLTGGSWFGNVRRATKTDSALQAQLLARPGLYRPHLRRLFLEAPAWGCPSLTASAQRSRPSRPSRSLCGRP